MTLFSAVSSFLTLAGAQAGFYQQKSADPLWNQLKRSVAVIQHVSQPSGVAVLISDEGYFLAHSSSVPTGPLIPAMLDGRPVLLEQKAADQETSLVLLKADQWVADFGTPVAVAGKEVEEGGRVTTVTINGPTISEVVSNSRIGQTADSLRYTPLSELRQEDIQTKLGGAAAFNGKGELVGILGATLPVRGNTFAGSRPGTYGGGGGVGAGGNVINEDRTVRYGPQGLSVGYALGPVLLERVVDGFLSPTHKVQHPSIGVFFKSAGEGGGVSIEAILPESPAAGAGLKVGDTIIEANGAKVFSPIEFAVLLFNQRIGADMKLVIQRGNQARIPVTVKVGVQSDNAQSQIFHR